MDLPWLEEVEVWRGEGVALDRRAPCRRDVSVCLNIHSFLFFILLDDEISCSIPRPITSKQTMDVKQP
jgi:hypothetical protein